MTSPLPLITVVVPVYKVEDFIVRCIESLIYQTYKHIEIILVDDGSPDNCGKICDEYATKDPRIKVIHQENKGLSEARNTGLHHATGSYIGFVDSDDYVEPEMYESLITVMLENDIKLGSCVHQKGELNYQKEFPESFYVETFDEALSRLKYPGFYNVTNKLYKSDVIEGLSFIKGKIYEDTLFISQVWQRIDKIVFIPKPYYIYNQEGESIIRSDYSLKNLDGFDVIVKAMQNFLKRARTSQGMDALRINYSQTLLFHFHALLEHPELDVDKVQRRRIWRLLKENTNRKNRNIYLNLVNFLPLNLYEIFYKLNTIRLKYKSL